MARQRGYFTFDAQDVITVLFLNYSKASLAHAREVLRCRFAQARRLEPAYRILKGFPWNDDCDPKYGAKAAARAYEQV